MELVNTLHENSEISLSNSTENDICMLDESAAENPDQVGSIESFKLNIADVSSDVSNVIKANNVSATNNSVMKYAPVMPVKRGTYDLYPISLSWTDVDGASRSRMKVMGDDVASTYARLSDGAIKFNVKNVGIYKTGVPRSASAVAPESEKARIMYTDRSSPYVGFYAIVNNGAKKVSHAGGKTASLLSPLLTTARHEVGHLLGLQHANRYVVITKGPHKGEKEFQSSRDGSSFMSIYASNNLTSAQMYAMGWYKQNQVAMYEVGDPAITYDLQPVCNKQNDNYLNAVYMPKKDGKNPVFLSMFESSTASKDRLMALHVGEKGGSTRLDVFKDHFETDDASIDLISEQNDYWKVKVSPKSMSRH